MKKLLFLALALLISTVSTAQEPSPDYGYSEEDPILVGSEKLNDGPANERAYLDLLTGPNGEEISYNRLGSCCEFETENSPFGGGLLDKYEVTYEGLDKPVILYMNMYDPDPDGIVQVPRGFKLMKK